MWRAQASSWMQELKMQREMRGGAHMSTPLARRSTERRDLRSDNANREFEDETKECDELRAAFSVSKKERGRTCAWIPATNMKKIAVMINSGFGTSSSRTRRRRGQYQAQRTCRQQGSMQETSSNVGQKYVRVVDEYSTESRAKFQMFSGLGRVTSAC